MSSPCEVERLVLLLYPDELEAEDASALRVHLTLCARCEEIYAELEAVAAQLDLIPEARLSSSERRALLARVVTATAEGAGASSAQDSDIQAALDLVDLPGDLDEDARASLREGVLAQVGLAADFVEEDFAALRPALDLVEAPTLSEDARAALRDAVLARVGIAVDSSDEALAHEHAALEPALDQVEAPTLSEDARAALRDAVLARVGITVDSSDEALAHEHAALEPALDQVEAPTLSEDARVELRDAVLARVGIAAAPASSSEAPRRGLLLRLPAWTFAAAAALLLAGSAALYLARPAQGPSLASAFVEAEKLVRDAPAEEGLHLVAARDRLQRVVLAQSHAADLSGESSEELRRARRELLALGALHLRSEALNQGGGIRPVPLRRSPEDFLRSKHDVLLSYPESLAALFVLKCYGRLAARGSAPALEESEDEEARLAASLASQLDALRARDADALDLDLAELERRFSPSLARAARQALWIQRGLQAERQGERVQAQAWYLRAHDDDPATAAAEIARKLRERL